MAVVWYRQHSCDVFMVAACWMQYSCDVFMVAVCSIHVMYSWLLCAVFMWCFHGCCVSVEEGMQYSCAVFIQHSCDVFIIAVGCMRQVLSNRWQYSCNTFVITAFDVCCQTGDSIHVTCSWLLRLTCDIKQVTVFMWYVCDCCVWRVLSNRWQYSCDVFVTAEFDVCCQTGDSIHVMCSWLLSLTCVIKQVTVFMWCVRDCRVWRVLSNRWRYSCQVVKPLTAFMWCSYGGCVL